MDDLDFSFNFGDWGESSDWTSSALIPDSADFGTLDAGGSLYDPSAGLIDMGYGDGGLHGSGNSAIQSGNTSASQLATAASNDKGFLSWLKGMDSKTLGGLLTLGGAGISGLASGYGARTNAATQQSNLNQQLQSAYALQQLRDQNARELAGITAANNMAIADKNNAGATERARISADAQLAAAGIAAGSRLAELEYQRSIWNALHQPSAANSYQVTGGTGLINQAQAK